ncbi:MAG TPA: FecR family protein [Candidatus Binataceae bacterium]|nr:FecR family protein [Candidatus Binataceae bacterium]
MHTTRWLAAGPKSWGKSEAKCRARHSSLSGLVPSIFAAILIGLCVSASLVCAQVAAGSITALVGTASIERAGKALDAAVAMPVQVADRIAVNASSKLTITLNDGSVLEVGASSTLVIDEQLLGPGGARASTRVSLFAGILRSVARHGSGGSLPNFEVHTPNAIMAARGTVFDTQYTGGARRAGYGDATQFTDERTLNGTVGARNAAGGDEVSVPAGYETTIAGASTPTSPKPINVSGISWVAFEGFTASEPGAEIIISRPPPPPPGHPALPPTVGVISPPPPPPPPPPVGPPSLPSFPR